MSNVDGYVKHYATEVDQSFVFPVGTGSDLRTLTVSGSRSSSSVIATAWVLGDPSNPFDPTGPNAGMHSVVSFGTGVSSVSTVGQWDWQDLSSDASGLTVVASIPDMSSFGSASDLRLVGWNGTDWVNLSGSTGASASTENSTLSGVMINGITAIGIGLASTTLDPCDAVASGNVDTDGDGISNICDLDDDNDGILDVDESCGVIGESVEWSDSVTDGATLATFENTSDDIVATFTTDLGTATSSGFPRYKDDPDGLDNGTPYVEMTSRHTGAAVSGSITTITLSQPVTIEHFIVKSVARNLSGSYNEAQEILFYSNGVQVEFTPVIEKAIPANGINGASYDPSAGLAIGAINYGSTDSNSNEANFLFNIDVPVDEIIVRQASLATYDNISIEI